MSYLEEATLIQEWAKGTEIVLDNIPMTIEGGVGYQLTNVYGRPERQGEPGPADHPFNVTHTQRTWVNGQLRRDAQEAADIGVYWDAHAWVQNRGKVGAPLLTRKIPIPVEAITTDNPNGGMVTPHVRVGQHMIWTVGNINGRVYESHATDTQMHLPGGHEIVFEGTVTNKGTVFRTAGELPGEIESWLYLPSTAGYTRIKTDTYETIQAPSGVSYNTVGVTVHENKLYRLTTSGQVFFIIHHDDDWDLVATIPDGSDPRQIFQTYDDDGNRVVGVATSTGLFLLDHDNQILWMTDLYYPEHAYQGFGATLWRADDWISVGVGIHRRVGNLVTPEGLDNYDGLPDPLAGGHIRDLAPSYNWLLAAIAGDLPFGDEEDEVRFETFGLTTNIPYPLFGLGSSATFLSNKRIGAIFAWNGLGWSRLYQWNRPPTRVCVSMVQNTSHNHLEQHLFFGDYDGGAYSIEIPSNYYNPLISPTLPLERSWYLEESRVDWDAPDIPKVAKQFNCKVDHLYHELQVGPDLKRYHNRIEVICHWLDLDGIYHTSEDTNLGDGPYPFMSVDPSTGFGTGAPLPHLVLEVSPTNPSVSDNSRRSAPIGWERYRNTGEILATGLPHERIWFTYRGLNDTNFETEKFLGYPERNIPPDPDRQLQEQTSGLIEWRSIIARKWMRPNRVFTFVVETATGYKGESEEDLLGALDAICLKKAGVPLVLGDRMYIVDVTRLDGANEAGLSPRGTRTITCLEFTDVTYEDSIPVVP